MLSLYLKQVALSKMIKFLLIISFLIPEYSLASDCKTKVQVIKRGDIAECDGFLFSPQAEAEARQAVDDAKYYNDLSKLLHDRTDLMNKELATQDQRLKLYMDTNQILADQLVRKEHEDFWQKTVYFGLGVIVTGAAVSLAHQAIK